MKPTLKPPEFSEEDDFKVRLKSSGGGKGYRSGRGVLGFLAKNNFGMRSRRTGFKGSDFSGRYKSSFRGRRVAVKARFVKNGGAGKGSFARHFRYILREGVGQDGLVPSLFGSSDGTDKISLPDILHDWSKDRHTWRFIVSPEDGKRLDLEDFTRLLVGRMERDLGTRLEWTAVIHTNTEKPHCHLVIRGKRDDGKDLVIGKDYLSFGMRRAASELSTLMLGERSLKEIVNALRRDSEAERFCDLDRELQRLEKRAESGLVELKGDRCAFGVDRETAKSLLEKRIHFLLQLGLANREGSGRFFLKPGWEDILRRLGVRGDRLKTLHEKLYGKALSTCDVFEISEGKSLKGKVLHSGLEDELSERAFMLLESANEVVHYVPLPRPIKGTGLEDLVLITGEKPDWVADSVSETLFEHAKVQNGIITLTNLPLGLSEMAVSDTLSRLLKERIAKEITPGSYLIRDLLRVKLKVIEKGKRR